MTPDNPVIPHLTASCERTDCRISSDGARMGLETRTVFDRDGRPISGTKRTVSYKCSICNQQWEVVETPGHEPVVKRT